MEMTKFKVGDRVRVYPNGSTLFDGIITSIHSDNICYVTEDGFYSAHNDGPFHFKQCRRLVKKNKTKSTQQKYKFDIGDFVEFKKSNGEVIDNCKITNICLIKNEMLYEIEDKEGIKYSTYEEDLRLSTQQEFSIGDIVETTHRDKKFTGRIVSICDNFFLIKSKSGNMVHSVKSDCKLIEKASDTPQQSDITSQQSPEEPMTDRIDKISDIDVYHIGEHLKSIEERLAKLESSINAIEDPRLHSNKLDESEDKVSYAITSINLFKDDIKNFAEKIFHLGIRLNAIEYKADALADLYKLQCIRLDAMDDENKKISKAIDFERQLREKENEMRYLSDAIELANKPPSKTESLPKMNHYISANGFPCQLPDYFKTDQVTLPFMNTHQFRNNPVLHQGSFEWAIVQLKNGKKIRRKAYYEPAMHFYIENKMIHFLSEHHLLYNIDGNTEYGFSYHDVIATDWEIVE